MSDYRGRKKAMQTIKERYGEDFHKKIGSKGGKQSTTGGFFANRELAKAAGAKGGKLSKRGKKLDKVTMEYEEFDHPDLVETDD